MSTSRAADLVTAHVTNDRAKLVFLVLSGALIVVAYWHTFAWFVDRWFAAKDYYHCPLVPAIIAYLLWRKREELAGATQRLCSPGLLLLAFGLLLHLAAMRVGVRFVSGVSLPIVGAGFVLSVFGPEVLRLTAIAYPLALFLVPYPQHMMAMIAMPMQLWSATAAALIGKGMGLPVIHSGINLTMNDFTFVVAQECSGINSLQALLLTAFIAIHLMAMSLGRKAALLLSVLPIVFIANSVRVASVLVTAQFFGPHVATGFFVHGFSDIVVYMVAFICFILLGSWLAGAVAAPSPAHGIDQPPH